MNDPQERHPFPLGFPVLLLGTAVVTGMLWRDRPYIPTRPGNVNALSSEVTGSLGRVPGRLWEDPFSATSRDGHCTIDDVRREIESRYCRAQQEKALPNGSQREDTLPTADSPENHKPSILILPVLVPGGEWPIDMEARIRERHAVVMACLDEKWVPSDDRLIGVMATDWVREESYPGAEIGEHLRLRPPSTTPARESYSPVETLELKVPFEWFELPAEASSRSALVLWFDETFPANALYPALDQLLSQLLGGSGRVEEGFKKQHIQVTTIGPSNSSSLKALAPTAESTNGHPRKTLGHLAADWKILESEGSLAEVITQAASDLKALKHQDNSPFSTADRKKLIRDWTNTSVRQSICGTTADVLRKMYREIRIGSEALGKALSSNPNSAENEKTLRTAWALAVAELGKNDPAPLGAINWLLTPSYIPSTLSPETINTLDRFESFAKWQPWALETLRREHRKIDPAPTGEEAWSEFKDYFFVNNAIEALKRRRMRLDGLHLLRAHQWLLEREPAIKSDLETSFQTLPFRGKRGLDCDDSMHATLLLGEDAPSTRSLCKLLADNLQERRSKTQPMRHNSPFYDGTWEFALARWAPGCLRYSMTFDRCRLNPHSKQAVGDILTAIETCYFSTKTDTAANDTILVTQDAATDKQWHSRWFAKSPPTGEVFWSNWEDARRKSGVTYTGVLHGSRLFSPRATAEAVRRKFGDRESPVRPSPVHSWAPGKTFEDVRFFVRDDLATLEALKSELEHRGVDLDTPKSMLLIVEQDTVYGRELPGTVSRSLLGQGDETDIPTIQYIRGLDGFVYDSVPNSEEKSPLENARLELAEGPSQLDYVRRMAKKLIGDRPPASIGVLGSDIHDKMLILQAFRDVFPSAVFFTTDIEARYLDPEIRPYSRGLIVASSLGLCPEEEEEEESDDGPDLGAHFRDSYQHATYLAVQAALSEPPSDHRFSGESDRSRNRNRNQDPDRAHALDQLGEVELFEVGRSSFIRLGEVDFSRLLQTLLAVAGGLGLITLFLLRPTTQAGDTGALTRRQRLALSGRSSLLRFLRCSRHAHPVALLAWGAGALALVVALGLLDPGEGGWESFAAGASVWTSTAIRLAVIAICVPWWVSLERRQLEVNSQDGTLPLASLPLRLLVPAALGAVATASILALSVLTDLFQWPLGRELCRGLLSWFGSLTTQVGLLWLLLTMTAAGLCDLLDIRRHARPLLEHGSLNTKSWNKLAENERSELSMQLKTARRLAAMRALGERTECAAQVTFLSLILLSGLLFAQLPLFERWQFHATLLVVAVGCLLVSIGIALALRGLCEQAREALSSRLKVDGHKLRDRIEQGTMSRKWVIGHEYASEVVTDFGEGAFASFLKRPIVRFAALPFSGVSAIAILEILTFLNL